MSAPLAIKLHKAPIISTFEYNPTPNVAEKNPNALTIIDGTDELIAVTIESRLSLPLKRSFLYLVVIRIA